jgi:DeoR family glycerol-3-phosphate regulon repressor
MKQNRNATTRQLSILSHLKSNGRASVDELAEIFQTTPQTIRKDLSALEQNNQIMRFHGGASLVAGSEYLSVDARKEIARDEKEKIGQALASLVPNNSVLMLNAGTTTITSVPYFSSHLGLKVVTDSVLLANGLRECVGLEVMIPAGIVRSSDGAVLGESAVDFIRQFRADLAIIGAAAIAKDGALLDYDLRETAVTKAIIQSARNVILAADSSKFGQSAPIKFGHISDANTLVTDANASKELRNLCAEQGVQVHLAT